MSNKRFRIPTRDADFNIYQRDVRNYLNAATGGIIPDVITASSGGIPGVSAVVAESAKAVRGGGAYSFINFPLFKVDLSIPTS